MSRTLTVLAITLASPATAFDYTEGTTFFAPGPGAISAAIAQRDALAETDPALAEGLTDLIQAPMAAWLTQGTPDEVRIQTQQVMQAARARGDVPVFAAYNIPFRDCAQYSAGGATSPEEYDAWIAAIAEGIDDGPAIVILEPDGLAIIPFATTSTGDLDWCQPSDADPETAEAERYEMTTTAIDTLTANPGTKVYLDGGHADWHGPSEIAYRLLRANVQDAAGFFLNVSNYVETDRQIAHGERVAKCVFYGLNGGDTNDCTNEDAFYTETVDPMIAAGDAGQIPHFVIDTSRNGNGTWTPETDYPDAQVWCNPPGRAIGTTATTDTASDLADAYLWIKIPGESDGQCNRGLDGDGADPEWGITDPAAGEWFPEQVRVLLGARN